MYVKMLKPDVVLRYIDSNELEKSKTEPIFVNRMKKLVYEYDAKLLGKKKDVNLLFYQSTLYEVKGNYSEEEAKLLVMEAKDKESQQLKRLRLKFRSDVSNEITNQRPRIPENI